MQASREGVARLRDAYPDLEIVGSDGDFNLE